MYDDTENDRHQADAAPSKRVIFGFVFGIIATAVYFLCIGMNLSFFAYYPQVGELHGTEPLKGIGPPMFWYGWILNAIVAGTISGAAAWLLPKHTTAAAARVLALLVWTVPLAVLFATLYLIRHFFT